MIKINIFSNKISLMFSRVRARDQLLFNSKLGNSQKYYILMIKKKEKMKQLYRKEADQEFFLKLKKNGKTWKIYCIYIKINQSTKCIVIIILTI